MQLCLWFLRIQKRINGFRFRLLYQHIFFSHLPEFLVITHKLISLSLHLPNNIKYVWQIPAFPTHKFRILKWVCFYRLPLENLHWCSVMPYSYIFVRFLIRIHQVRRNHQPSLIYCVFLFFNGWKSVVKLQVDFFFPHLFCSLFTWLLQSDCCSKINPVDRNRVVSYQLDLEVFREMCCCYICLEWHQYSLNKILFFCRLSTMIVWIQLWFLHWLAGQLLSPRHMKNYNWEAFMLL